VVLGGGLSGLAAAWSLAGADVGQITIVERSPALGGLAGSFEHDGRFYPLGYHHILPTDRTLIHFLDLIGALSRVQWRRVRMLFRIDNRLYDFSKPADFLRLPLSVAEKLRFVAMMARAYRTSDWSEWQGRTAQDLVDGWGGASVRHKIFDPLCDLKFELSADQVSAAWMGKRLHAREGSGRLGYIPNTNWTKTLCEGMVSLVEERGVKVRANTAVTGFRTLGRRICQVDLNGDDGIEADLFVSAMPTNALALTGLQDMGAIRYTGLLSLVGGTRQPIPDHFYWLNLLSPRLTACGIFRLSTLNPTIGAEGEHCLNFVTHLRSPASPLFRLDEGELVARYVDDYRTVFGLDLQLDWLHLSRIAGYSPVFTPEYRNPDIHGGSWENLYLTGNYRTYPSVASTGTALQAGLETAGVVLEELTSSKRAVPAGSPPSAS
jgi:protoporphyrinogen oxidase